MAFFFFKIYWESHYLLSTSEIFRNDSNSYLFFLLNCALLYCWFMMLIHCLRGWRGFPHRWTEFPQKSFFTLIIQMYKVEEFIWKVTFGGRWVQSICWPFYFFLVFSDGVRGRIGFCVVVPQRALLFFSCCGNDSCSDKEYSWAKGRSWSRSAFFLALITFIINSLSLKQSQHQTKWGWVSKVLGVFH